MHVKCSRKGSLRGRRVYSLKQKIDLSNIVDYCFNEDEDDVHTRLSLTLSIITEEDDDPPPHLVTVITGGGSSADHKQRRIGLADLVIDLAFVMRRLFRRKRAP